MYLSTADLLEIEQQSTTSQSGYDNLDGDWFTDRQAWYTLLLHQTLEFCERSVPFYKANGIRASQFSRLSDLRKFPVIHKSNISQDPVAFMSGESVSDCFHCTSGTTAKRLIVYRSSEEERALNALLGIAAPNPDGSQQIALRLFPNCLRVFAPSARQNISVYNIVVNFSLNQTHHQWFDNSDHIVEILNAEYLLGGKSAKVSIIHSTPPWLLDFVTRQISSRGIDPGQFGIKLIATSGGFTPRYIRESIHKQWGAECDTAYSCTEVNGEANESGGVPGDYLPNPAMFAEIVDIQGHEPVNDGETGVLLLTSLHPFQTVTPMIRYNTGDIAQRVPIAGHSGEQPFLIRPIGRAPHCLQLSQRVFLGTRDVLEALSDFSVVPQFPYPRYQLSLREDSTRHKTAVLNIESTELSSVARKRLESEIANALLKQFRSRHRDAENTPLVNFEVNAVGKGELERFLKLYPDR